MNPIQPSGQSDEELKTTEADSEKAKQERFELLHHVSSFLEPVMVVLGFVFLVLLLLDFSAVPFTVFGQNRIPAILQWIWGIFLLDFVLRFVIAPGKMLFLRRNWLGALSLVLPFLRPLRAFQITRAVRGMSLVRLLSGVNRGMRIVRDVTRGRQFAFVAMLTVIVVLGGAAGSFFFDRGNPHSPINTLGDALWWSTTLVTTVSSELYVVSTEARLIALLQRVFALSIFGYITATIASYLIDTGRPDQEKRSNHLELRDELRSMHKELAEMRKLLESKSLD